MSEKTLRQQERLTSEFRKSAESVATLHSRPRPRTARLGSTASNATLNTLTDNSPDYDKYTISTNNLTGVMPLPNLERVKERMIRPMSAFYHSTTTNRYLTERLRAMYRQRRASSATSRGSSCLEPQPTAKNTNNNNNNNSRVNLEQESDKLSQNPVSQTNFSNLKPLVRFRTMANLVISIRRLMDTIVDNCSTNTMRSANELQWMTVYAEKHDVTLAFNKHLFSRDRVTTHVPDWALSILHLPPEDRSEQDCLRLHALLRGMKSFDKFTGEIQMFLCRAFTLERVAEGRVVLKSGHVGINFYLIYSGSVFVNVDDSSKDGRAFMRTVAVLTRGESFGELALLQDIRRTATVSVRERCELLAVDKNVFASVCPRIFEKELAEKYSFLSNLDLFSANYWSSESIRSLAMNAQLQEYKINKVIVTDSSTEDWIYICMQGRCNVVRCLSLDQPIRDEERNRKMSEVILSEEILQLLSATVDHPTRGSHRDENMKENLLTSLGLDYVQTGKKLYTNGGQGKKISSNANETMTLTTFVKRYMESMVNDYVILRLGVIEAGQVFDLPSLLDKSPWSETTSPLMLVSGGAKVVRVKKAAFFDQVSQQALDNTRTLASKRRNPSDESILESYKCKVAWDEFKSGLVHYVLRSKDLRYQPIYRGTVTPGDLRIKRPHSHAGDASRVKSSKIISVLKRNHMYNSKAALSLWSWSDESSFEEDDPDDSMKQPAGPTTSFRSENNYFESIESVNKNETIIMRRHPPRNLPPKRIVRAKDIIPRTPTFKQ